VQHDARDGGAPARAQRRAGRGAGRNVQRDDQPLALKRGSLFRRIERSFPTDARAEPVHPDDGIASDA
jgi:hypothetical protein